MFQTNPKLLKLEGRIGRITPGAVGDLAVFRANPLDQIGVLADPEKQLRCVVQGGQVVFDRDA